MAPVMGSSTIDVEVCVPYYFLELPLELGSSCPEGKYVDNALFMDSFFFLSAFRSHIGAS